MRVRVVVGSAVSALFVGALAVAVLAEPAGAQAAPLPSGGSYHALTATRILDTRSGLGAPSGPTQSVTVRTAGVGGIPTSGVSAVAVNLTVAAPSGSGFVVGYPAGATRPTASDANYVKGQTVAAMTILGVNAAGEFTIYSAAPAQLVADVAGYFTTPQAATTAGLYNSLTPTRIMDTRTHLGGSAPGPHGITTVQVTGVGGVPTSGVSAVVINTTVTVPTSAGFVTAYPAGIAPPGASTINFLGGETRANRAIVPVGQDGKISFYNVAGTTQLVIDVDGYFADGTGSYYVPTTPYRMVDGRSSCGSAWHDPDTTGSLGVTVDAPASATNCAADRAPSQWDVAPARAVWLTLTAVQASPAGPITAYPAGVAKPQASDLNATSAIVANSGPVGVGTNGSIQIASSAGFLNSGSSLLVDISGYFADAPKTPSPQGIWATGLSGVPDAFQFAGLADVRAFAGWPGLALALRSDGTVLGWGAPSYGGGHLSTDQNLSAVAGTNVTQIVGGDTTYFLYADGTVLALGSDNYGEFGDGTHTDPGTGVYVIWGGGEVGAPGGKPAIDNVVTLGAGTNIGYAVKADGTVWAWGRNNAGQLGNGTTTDSYTPVQVSGLTGVTSIAGDPRLSYAIDADGHLWKWGDGEDLVPQQFTGACAVGVSVVADSSGAWELCNDGTVWQLDHRGMGVYSQLRLPRQLPSLTNITAIATDSGADAPGTGVQALDSDGQVWRYAPATDSFTQVYGLNGISTLGSNGHFDYAAAS